MFSLCKSLEYLALPNQMSSLTYIFGMFSRCYKLTSIDLRFMENISKVEMLDYMFMVCENLIEIEFPNVHIDYLKSATEMFSRCSKIKRIDLGKLKVKNFSEMSMMFMNCKNLKFLNITNLDMRNVSSYQSIFDVAPKNMAIIYDPNKTREDIEKILINQTLEK